MSPSNLSFMADTISCHVESAGERRESPERGGAEGKSEGSSPASSGSETSDLGGVLDTIDASSSALDSSSCASSLSWDQGGEVDP